MADCKDPRYNIFNSDFDTETGNEVIDDPTTGSQTSVVVDVDAYDSIGDGTGAARLTSSLGSSRFDITTTGAVTLGFTASSNTMNIDAPIYVTSGSDGMLAYYDGAGSQINDAINLYYDDTGKKLGIQTLSPSGSLTISGSDNTLLFLAQSDSSSSIMFVTGSGRVGLNFPITVEPTAQLSISASEGAGALIPFGIYGNDASSTKAIEFKVNSNHMGQLYLYRGGSTAFNFDAQTGASTFNDMGFSTGDTRMESDNNTHMVFVDASEDKVGIGTDAPTATLAVTGTVSVSGTLNQQVLINEVAVGRGKKQGHRNTALGESALDEGTSSYGHNTALGWWSQKNNSQGKYNTSVGASTLPDSTGYFNTVIGASGLTALTSGYSNLAAGYLAGSTITTGFKNTLLGYNTKGPVDSYNMTVIGNAASSSASNEIVLGNASITKLYNMGDNTSDLGQSSNRWKNLYVGTNALISGSSANLTITGSDNSTLFGVHSDSNANILTVTGSGRVGIGTASPDAALHIKPYGTEDAFSLIVDGPGGEQGYIGLFRNAVEIGKLAPSNSNFNIISAGNADIVFATGSSYTNIAMMIDSSTGGKVGIGTANPTHKLSVNGGASFAGDVAVTGTLTADKFVVSTTYITSSIIYESGSTKFGDTSDDTHQFTGSILVNGSLSANSEISSSATVSASNIYLPMSGKLVFNADDDSKNYISADSTGSMIKFFMNDNHVAEFQDSAFVMRTALFLIDGKELKFGNSDDMTMRFNTTRDRFEAFKDAAGMDTSRFHINQDGYFGIGDNAHSASALLHVSGSDNTSLFKVGSDSNANIFRVSGSGAININGTGSTYPLTIHGDGTDDDVFAIRGSDGGLALRVDTTNTNCSILKLYRGGTANHTINSTGDVIFNEAGLGYDFRIESDNNTHMFFLDGSEDAIGINTSTPTYTLDVVGDVRISSSAARLEVTGSDNSMVFGVHSTTNANILTVTGSGRVGIGTSDPEAALHVEGSQVYLPNEWVFASDTDTMIRKRTSNSMEFRLAGADYYVIDATNGHYIETGNFGIGYTPTATIPKKLSVAGDALITNVALISGSTARLEITGSDNSMVFGVHSTSKENILVVTGSGRVSINPSSVTSNPTAGLNVRSISNANVLKMERSDAAGVSMIARIASDCEWNVNGSDLLVVHNYGENVRFSENGAVRFSSSLGTSRLEVTGSDNSTLFGVHSATRPGILKVSGSGLITMTGPGGTSSPTPASSNTVLYLDNHTGDSNSKCQLDINAGGAGGAQVRFFEAGTEYSSIVGTNDSLIIKTEAGMAGNDPIIFSPGGSEKLRIDSTNLSSSVAISASNFIADAGSTAQLAYAINTGTGDPSTQMGFYAASNTALYLVMGGSQRVLWDTGNNSMRMGGMGISWADSAGTTPAAQLNWIGDGRVNFDGNLTISGSRAAYGGTTARLAITGSDNSTLFGVHSATNANILTVTGSGKVGIGTSSPSSSLHVHGNETYPIRASRVAGGGDFGIYLEKATSGHWNILNEGNRLSFAYLGTGGGSNTKLLRLESSGQLMPNADNSYKLGGTSNRWSQLHVGAIYETSERQLKENITPQTSELDNIMKLNPVDFNWRDNNKKSKGFIADEVEEIYPELVGKDEEGKATGIEYTKMISVLTQGMQELNEIVNKQQETIEKLLKKIEDKN